MKETKQRIAGEKLNNGKLGINKAMMLDATLQSLVKLNPKVQVKNPVMFIVYIGAIITTILWLLSFLSSGFEIFFEKSPKCIAVHKVNQATSASCKAIASLAIRAFTSSSCVCFAFSADIALTTKIVPPILSTKPVFIFSTVITSLRKNRGVRFRTPRYQPKKDYSFS